MMRFIKEEKGQGMAEYGLILALVSIAAIVGLGVLGPNISDMFDAVGQKLVITAPAQ